MKIQLLFFAVMLAMASRGLPATDSAPVPDQPAQETPQTEKTSQIVKPVRGITQVRGRREELEMHEDRDSQLNTFILDGSSEAAFEASLKQLQETAPTLEYRSVKSAIQYLLVYDLSARGNKEKLYKKLNGKTAEEIIALAKR